MSIDLRVCPNDPPVSWQLFCRERSMFGFAIALDGYVHGPPAFDPLGPFANFDHHTDVDRLATRATAAQVLMAARAGLRTAFTSMGHYSPTVWVNDCDPDVILSTWLLEHIELLEDAVNPPLNRLVHMCDMLDTTGGMYPYPPESEDMERRAWIFESYWKFRQNGGLAQRNAEEYERVIMEGWERIDLYMEGKWERIPLDTRYNVLEEGNGWSMVEEIGMDARTAMVADGVEAFVSVRPGKDDAHWVYTLCRISNLIHRFDLPYFYTMLNVEEGIKPGEDMWGGSDLIGGSPRVATSALAPSKIKDILDRLL